jgi:hypothetical protein
MRSLVLAPSFVAGGVKSLYAVCEWLDRLGICRVQPFWGDNSLANWFEHDCQLYDSSYEPELVVYPEVHQPDLGPNVFHLCFALGQHEPVRDHAQFVVCRSPRVQQWVREHAPQLPTKIISAGINRRPFEYDGREKQDQVCYFTRPDKHPETAADLRARYGKRVIEISGRTEREVAEILKDSKVLVWRGHDKEGSPRPPKEALVAGCVVIGLEQDLHPQFSTDFGIKCRSLEELLDAPAEALKAKIPTKAERAVVHDSEEERKDWESLLATLDFPSAVCA